MFLHYGYIPGEGGAKRQYKTSFHALRSIIANEGILAVYTGWAALVVRMTYVNYCVVIYFWSGGIIDCMLFTFEIEFRSWARGVRGVASFITTDKQLQ